MAPNFQFVVPVRDPDHWSRSEVVERLCSTVGFLSDDKYRLEFQKIIDPPPSQAYLPFDEAAEASFTPRVIIPFSGGLDSLAGAIEEASAGNGRAVLVSHRASTKLLDHQKRLFQKLSSRFAKKLLHVPLMVTTQEHLPVKDYNQRSRSFLYAALACAVGHTLGVNHVRFFENGTVSINLPVSEQVVGSRATRTTHPRAIRDFSEFFGAALESEIDISNPYLWHTKRDVIQAIVEQDCGDLINDSISCTRVHEMTKLHTHCGRCSQCIDRRFGILAANAEAHDSADQYACELLTSPREDKLDRTMGESYTRTAVRVSGMNDVAFFSQFGGNVATLLDSLPAMGADKVGQAVYDLYHRHAANVTHVLAKAVAQRSADLVGQRLPASCILVMSVSQGVIAAPDLLPRQDCRTLPRIPDEPFERTVLAEHSPLPLQLAIDHETGDVVVRDVTRLTGADSKLVCALEVFHREDRQAGRAPENFRYMTPDKLANSLGYADEVAVRQRVSRCRKDLREAFLTVHDQKLPTGSLIETRRPDGYRLNPQIRFIAASEISSIPTVSRRTNEPVT
jgi:7-cyano-7-deazaguanine synthase in queuosine biosynthesis